MDLHPYPRQLPFWLLTDSQLDSFASSVLPGSPGNQKCFRWSRMRGKARPMKTQSIMCVLCELGLGSMDTLDPGICTADVLLWGSTPWHPVAQLPGIFPPGVTCSTVPLCKNSSCKSLAVHVPAWTPLQQSNWYWSKQICVPLTDICSVKRSGFCSRDRSCLPHYHTLLPISSSKVSSDFCCCSGWGSSAQSAVCQPGSSVLNHANSV